MSNWEIALQQVFIITGIVAILVFSIDIAYSTYKIKKKRHDIARKVDTLTKMLEKEDKAS